MSYTKIWLHCVWTTKNSKPFLIKEIRQTVFQHIKENAALKNIYIDSINGFLQHAHCLINLKREQTIADCMQLIKGESSFWINHNKMIPHKFMWQDDYWAVSVSPSDVTRVRKYIQNQEAHHSNRSFEDEYKEFKTKFGIE